MNPHSDLPFWLYQVYYRPHIIHKWLHPMCGDIEAHAFFQVESQ